MKNKGFTLIELLAVIALIGLVGTVGISSLIRTRKNTNIKLAKEMENDIKVAGENLFSYEKINSPSGDFYKEYKSGNPIYISTSKLYEKKYLKSSTLKNPAKKDKNCGGYLKIQKTTSGPSIKGYISCEGLYTTKYDESDYYVTIVDSDYFTNITNTD